MLNTYLTVPKFGAMNERHEAAVLAPRGHFRKAEQSGECNKFKDFDKKMCINNSEIPVAII